MATEKRVDYRENAPIPPEPKPPKESKMLKFFQYIYSSTWEFLFSCLAIAIVTTAVGGTFWFAHAFANSESGKYTFCYIDIRLARPDSVIPEGNAEV